MRENRGALIQPPIPREDEARAMTVRGYFLLKVETGRGDVADRVRSQSLANAKHLVWPTFPGELIVHIDGSNPSDLEDAVHALQNVPGVIRAVPLQDHQPAPPKSLSDTREILERAFARCAATRVSIDGDLAHQAAEDKARLAFLEKASDQLAFALETLPMLESYALGLDSAASALGGPLTALLGFWMSPEASHDADVCEMAGHAELRAKRALEDLGSLAAALAELPAVIEGRPRPKTSSS